MNLPNMPAPDQLLPVSELPYAYAVNNIEMDNGTVAYFHAQKFPKILPVAMGIYALVDSEEKVLIDRSGTTHIEGDLITGDTSPDAYRPRVLTSIAAVPRRRKLVALFGGQATTRQARVYFAPPLSEVEADTKAYYKRLEEEPEIF